jgi:benzoate/toluate 1,2-dioxygenase beta subunit
VLDVDRENGTADLTTGEASRLLFHEARLLDERRYDEWIELMTDDVDYWIPSWRTEDEPIADGTRALSLLHCDREMLIDYVTRAKSGEAHVMDPPARADRIVSNVLVEDPHVGTVHAKWTLHHFRRGRHDVFVGSCEYRLRRAGSALCIAAKKVLLSNSSLEHGYLPLV